MNAQDTSWPGSPVAKVFSALFQASADVAVGIAPEKTDISQDSIMHEAFQLHNLQAQSNSSLLDFGLNLGFIARRPNDGRLTIDSLNAFPMSVSRLVDQLVGELLMRLFIFVPATTLIKLAIDSNNAGPDHDDAYAVRGFYIGSIIIHQIAHYNETSLRTMNRLLMCIAIILFSLTTPSSKPCKDMKKFKEKIETRLLIDYYSWCLLLAMDLLLTCGSPLYINLEYAHGVELHLIQLLLSLFCVSHLCFSMRLIGFGRLTPLITGTPLLFIDAGDDITIAKGATLFFCYFAFWCSDWRELVDWNHSLLCDAGICKLLNTEHGNLRTKAKKAKIKFDDWRLEEGLDDDGWFILLDAPSNPVPGPTNRPSETNSTQGEAPSQASDDGLEEDSADRRPHDQSPPDEPSHQNHQEENNQGFEEWDDPAEGPSPIDYADRVIYLQSRNPLLTTLAAIMLMVWK